MAARVALATGTSVKIAQRPRLGDLPKRYVPDTSRAQTELGLSLRVDLDEAIRRTLAFHGR